MHWFIAIVLSAALLALPAGANLSEKIAAMGEHQDSVFGEHGDFHPYGILSAIDPILAFRIIVPLYAHDDAAGSDDTGGAYDGVPDASDSTSCVPGPGPDTDYPIC